VKVRTSSSDPIRVDWIAKHVGLTFAPGKHADSKYEDCRWERDVALDLDRLVEVHGMQVQVCLLEDHELEQLRIPNLVAEAKRRGVRVLRLPIRDVGVPHDVEAVRALVEQLVDATSRAQNVVIHCAGGLGRAGTLGGCVLRRLGTPVDEVFALLQKARGPNCPETEAQRAFVRGFAAV
jgi:ADP-ribosyl-[dinitrogen reductase] hydrolase